MLIESRWDDHNAGSTQMCTLNYCRDPRLSTSRPLCKAFTWHLDYAMVQSSCQRSVRSFRKVVDRQK